MKLKNQVSSPKQSKELEKLGVKQESLWMWVKYELWKEPRIWQSDLATDVKVTCLSGKREYAYCAFTASEILERLPKQIPLEDCCVRLNIEPVRLFEKGSEWQWLVKYYGEEDRNRMLCDKYDKVGNLPNALAKMLIYLKKNKLINEH